MPLELVIPAEAELAFEVRGEYARKLEEVPSFLLLRAWVKCNAVQCQMILQCLTCSTNEIKYLLVSSWMCLVCCFCKSFNPNNSKRINMVRKKPSKQK